MVSYISLLNLALFIYMRLAQINKFTKLDYQQELSLQSARIMLMMVY